MSDSAEDLPELSDEALAEEIELMRRKTLYRNIFELLGDLPDRHQRNVYKIASGLDIVVQEISHFNQADRVKVIQSVSRYLHQFS